ncbi:UNVERIFIED_CONTAM: hypothetical protein GTU68_059463 [Idotea baltica]|nr:hypothetical protein [Idotea baltica]
MLLLFQLKRQFQIQKLEKVMLKRQ